MKLIMFEIYKLFSKKLFLICLVLFFSANSIFLVYTQSNNLETKTVHNNLSDYENIISEYSDYVPSEAQRQLESELKTVEIAMQIDRTADQSTDDDVENLERITEQYKAEYPEEYKKAQTFHFTRQELRDKHTYLSNLVNQCKYFNDYNTFISNMDQRADQLTKYSIFAKEGSFSYNNILKTAADFENINNTKLKIGNNFAIENSTTFVLTDLLVFALVFLMCICIFTLEREKELYGLIRTTQNGRMPLIISKSSVLILLTILISVIYYSSNIAVCGLYSGFGDMTRNIQSSELFMNCNFNLQIWQYLVLWCLSKTITMCVLALLVALIFVVIKNTAIIFAVAASGIFAEGIIYLAIGSNSPFNQLKYINFFYFFSRNNIFGNYLNINLFSQPVNITVIYATAMILIAIASATIICGSFVKSTQTSRKNVFMPILERFRRKFCKIQGSVSIFRGECFKHYKGSMAALALVLLAFAAYSNLNDNITVVYSSAQESAYSSYLNVLEGPITQDKEKYLSEQQQYFDDLNEKLDSIFCDSSLSSEEKEMKTAAIQSIIDTKGAAFSEVMEQKCYIIEKGEELDLIPQFINRTVYKRLVENPQREWNLFFLLMVVIIFISSDVFAYEHKKQMMNLIRCNRNGKFKLVLTKTVIALITTVVSFVLVYLPYYINFIKTFGTVSFDSPIVFIQSFSGVNSSISINETIFLISIVHLLFALMTSMLVMMFSQIFKNNIISMIISSVLILFPCIICMNISEIRLYTAFQNGIWMILVPVLWIVSIIVFIMCFVVVYLSFSKESIKLFRRIKNAHA